MTTTEAMSRHAGPIAIVAGLLFAALDLGRLPIAAAEDRAAALRDPLLVTLNAGYFFGFCALMMALIALHGRQARQAGAFGTIAFGAAVVGTMTMAGDMWFDGFASPWLAEVAPQVFTTLRPTPILEIGALLSYGLMALGWMLYGLATLRARVFPTLAAIGLIVHGPDRVPVQLPAVRRAARAGRRRAGRVAHASDRAEAPAAAASR